MIRSFRCPETQGIWLGHPSRRFPPGVQPVARRKLRMLNNAQNLVDLKVPPGNRLERLRGNRAGHHSIRVNDRWRMCFVWTTDGVTDVEMVDYH